MTQTATPPGNYWTIDEHPELTIAALGNATPASVQFYVMNQDLSTPNRDFYVTWASILANIPFSEVADDTTPSLGGNLDTVDFSIFSTGAGVTFGSDVFMGPGITANIRNLSTQMGDMTIAPTDNLVLKGLTWPAADGTANQVLETDGAGILGWTDGGGVQNPMMENLDVGVYQITSSTSNVVLSPAGKVITTSDLQVGTGAAGVITTSPDQNLVLTPDGSGVVELQSDLDMGGNTIDFALVGDINTGTQLNIKRSGNLKLTVGNTFIYTYTDFSSSSTGVHECGWPGRAWLSVCTNELTSDTDTDLVLNPNGIGAIDCSGNTFINARQRIKDIGAGTTPTVDADSGCLLRKSGGAGAATVEIHATAPKEFFVLILQEDADTVTVTSAGAGGVQGKNGTSTSGQYAMIAATVVDSDAKTVVTGDAA